MVTPYDLIITASSYLSPLHAARLIKSTHVLGGNVLAVITCPLQKDIDVLVKEIEGYWGNFLILNTQRRERHLCQDLGLLYCMANGLTSQYVMFSDDDIEFVGDQFFSYLRKAPQFSVLGFSSNTVHYGINPFQGEYHVTDYALNPCWVDGNNLITKWEDNVKCGMMDQVPGNFNSSFVEMEYQHRMRLLTGNPTVGCHYVALIHHSRVDNVEKLRDATNQQSVIHCGYQLWEKKFGLTMSAGDFNSGRIGWDDIRKTLAQAHYRDLYLRHLAFDGHWTDWDEIWKLFGPAVSVACKNLGG